MSGFSRPSFPSSSCLTVHALARRTVRSNQTITFLVASVVPCPRLLQSGEHDVCPARACREERPRQLPSRSISSQAFLREGAGLKPRPYSALARLSNAGNLVLPLALYGRAKRPELRIDH